MFILGLVFALLLLWVVALDKAYHRIPLKELKRRARAGDELAKALYKPAAYGLNVQLWLGVKAIVLAALSFVFFNLALPGWLAFLFIAFLLWLAFFWIPSTHLTRFGKRLAALSAPLIARSLHYLHPLLEPISRLVRKHYPHNFATGLYDTDDLINLLEWQKEQPDSRLSEMQITITQQALAFGDKLVRDIMLPRRAVKIVSAGETIGPVLIGELHAAGQNSFPVYDIKKDNITGNVELTDVLAAAKKGGEVKSIMHHKVYYIHEDFTLAQALQTFLETKHHLFIVVNKFEEFVGVLTIEDVLSQIVGQPIVDEFDNYSDRKAVAEAQAKHEHAEYQKSGTEPAEEETADQPPEDVLE
jgi:CBS domain containing-hemolysin-like protein